MGVTLKIPNYPTRADVTCSSWEPGFQFPFFFIQALHAKFPLWRDLQDALDRNDKELMWGLLDVYQNRLARITPEEIIDAVENRQIANLVKRAKEAIELKKFIADVEQCYFPERVREREEARRRADASWED